MEAEIDRLSRAIQLMKRNGQGMTDESDIGGSVTDLEERKVTVETNLQVLVLKVQNETSKNEIVNEAFTNNINKSFVKLKETRFIELKKTFNILTNFAKKKKLRTRKNYVMKGFNFAKNPKK